MKTVAFLAYTHTFPFMLPLIELRDDGEGTLPCKVFSGCISVFIYLRMTSVLPTNDCLFINLYQIIYYH